MLEEGGGLASAIQAIEGPERMRQERREGRTPNGGEWSVASYFDAHNQPVAKAEAAKVSIVEYNSDGIPIAETWGTVGH